MCPYNNQLDIPWCKFDFQVNKYYWQNHGFEKALPVRNKNLIDLAAVFDDCNVNFWLQGRTLLGLYSHGHLLDDHDDDVGIWARDRSAMEQKIHPRLRAQGFAMIRNNADIVSFIRDDRYIDVCLFEDRGRTVGYANKWFPAGNFADFDSIAYSGREFPVPADTEQLLRQMYQPGIFNRCSTVLNKLLKPQGYVTFYSKAIRKAANTLPHRLRIPAQPVLKTAGITYKKVSEQEFMATLIEPADSFNWRWRKPHLDIITDKGKYKRIGDIVRHLSGPKGLQNLIPQIKETDVSKPFYDPANMDRRFWQSGNNYFIYCIAYQFKHDVLPYSNANEYINRKYRPLLYTSKYYQSLPSMSDKQIQTLVKTQPIEISKDAITSGKHRACAMIGRLVSGKPYIPFWAIVK